MKTKNLMKTTIACIAITIIMFVFLIIVATMPIASIAHAGSREEIYYYDETYSDNSNETVATEMIAYSRKVTSTVVRVNNSFPAYYNTNSAITNCCANVAGANLFGFYDRYFEDIIPDCTPGMVRGALYNYYPMSRDAEKKQNLINDLYVRMGTNNPEPGTSQTGYKNGIVSFANSKNRSATFTSVMTNGALDVTKLRQSLSNGQPVSLYLSGYNISQLQDDGSTATLSKSIYAGNHIMIVYGCWTVDYYDANDTLIKSKTYLYVATGLLQTGYYVLNNNGTINDAEAVLIA